MDLDRAIEAAAEALIEAGCSYGSAERLSKFALEAATPILREAGWNDKFWHDLEQRADDLRAARRADNAYTDTPLMRALQRAERAEALAKELEDRMEQIRACLIELEHLTRKDFVSPLRGLTGGESGIQQSHNPSPDR